MDLCQVQSAYGSGGVGVVVVAVDVASKEIVVYKMQNLSQKNATNSHKLANDTKLFKMKTR